MEPNILIVADWYIYISQIQTGLEELQLFIVSKTQTQSPFLMGTLTISLSHLISQSKEEGIYNLYDKDGNATETKIKLEL